MNLTEAERLVRKITQLLQEPAQEAQAPKLAQEYADLCRAASHRLDQCAAMLQAGDDHQALQLAEAPPPLLDLITVLGFRQWHEWRGYCQAHGYPVPEAFDAKAIRLLNAAYAKGITTQHPLYRAYRQAVLKNNDEQALSVLRLIVRLNPTDANAPRELERLEEKVLNLKLSRLSEAVQARDQGAVLERIQEIESLRFSSAPQGGLWREAQAIRCQVLLEQAQQCRVGNQWVEALALLGDVQGLCAHYGLQFDADSAQAAAEVEAWATVRRGAFEEDQNFQRTLGELGQLLEGNEAKQLTTVHPGLSELRGDLETLVKKWREVEQFDRKVPEEPAARLQKNIHLLRSQMARRVKVKRNALALATFAFVIAALLLSRFYLSHRRARDLADEIQTMEARRQVVALEKFVAQVRSNETRLLNAPALRAALSSADGFLQREEEQKQGFARMMRLLAGHAEQGFTGLSPEQIQAQFDAARRYGTGLAPDFKPPAQADLLTFQNRWEGYLEKVRQTRTADFQKGLQEAVALARTDLDYAHGPERVRAGLAKLNPALQTLEALAGTPLAQLKVPSELALRFDSLKLRVAAYAGEVARWDKITATFHQPASLAAYLDALKTCQKSEFAEPAQVRAAGEITALNITTTNFLAAVLLPGKPEAWAAFQFNPALALYPAEVMPAERNKFIALRDDANIQNIALCKLSQKSLPPEHPLRSHLVFAWGDITTNRIGKKLGLIYDPQESPSATNFVRSEFRPSDFEIEKIGRSKEAEGFERIGMKELIDTTSGKYRLGFLEILDRLNQEREASPLFRAYLALRIFETLDLQALDWGGQWAPAAAEHRRRLLGLAADRLRSGDWMVPERITFYGKPLEEHFAQARTVSYVKQAAFFNKLVRRAAETGVAFVGFVDDQSEISPAQPPASAGGLWGWSRQRKEPALLFKTTGPDGRLEPAQEPLPWTPLFAFRADRRELLDQVAGSLSLSVRDEAVARFLPPLFAEKHE
ncbi:MAG: hypothetical protein HY674_11965 [Chloroflexi bacterium]|nr:hypothetical protein [Chloroflexota bacterium]